MSSLEETPTFCHDECPTSPEPSISQLVDECFPPTTELTVLSQTSSQYPPSPPVFASFPTGGPPEMPEPPLLSTLLSRSKPLVHALRSECNPNILPLNLIQAAVSHETQMPPQLPLSTRSTALQYDLLHLEKSEKTKADQLHLFYQLDWNLIELTICAPPLRHHRCFPLSISTSTPASRLDRQHRTTDSLFTISVHSS